MKEIGEERDFLTPNEVAKLLYVSPITIRQWARKGFIHAKTTMGGHRRFMLSEVERFAKEQGISLRKHSDEKKRILIVDDEDQVRRFLVTLLKTQVEGLVIEVAKDGFEAGKKVGFFKPDIILLDLMMPNMDGFEVCNNLKSDPQTKDIQIIVLSGYLSPDNKSKLLELGADACLAKPIDEDRLLALIR